MQQAKQTQKPSKAKGINDAFMKRLNENRDNIIDFTEEEKSKEQIQRIQTWIKKG